MWARVEEGHYDRLKLHFFVFFSCNHDALEEAGRQPVSAQPRVRQFLSRLVSSLSVIHIRHLGVGFLTWRIFLIFFWKRMVL